MSQPRCSPGASQPPGLPPPAGLQEVEVKVDEGSLGWRRTKQAGAGRLQEAEVEVEVEVWKVQVQD